jgi:hypothetical protein
MAFFWRILLHHKMGRVVLINDTLCVCIQTFFCKKTRSDGIVNSPPLPQ